MKYKTILLKLSGEALKANGKEVWDYKELLHLTNIIKEIHNKGIRIGIVVGGGNIFRGRVAEQLNLERVNADYMGMMATNINGMMLCNTFNQNGVKTTLYSAIPVENVIEKYNKETTLKDLDEGKVVIFAGGFGLPYYSTDTGSADKAFDIDATALLVGKHGVDGVYDKDPVKYNDAIKFDKITYDQIIDNNIQAMDIESIKLCKKNNTLVRVFNMDDLDNILKVLEDDQMGTTIRKE